MFLVHCFLLTKTDWVLLPTGAFVCHRQNTPRTNTMPTDIPHRPTRLAHLQPCSSNRSELYSRDVLCRQHLGGIVQSTARRQWRSAANPSAFPVRKCIGIRFDNAGILLVQHFLRRPTIHVYGFETYRDWFGVSFFWCTLKGGILHSMFRVPNFRDWFGVVWQTKEPGSTITCDAETLELQWNPAMPAKSQNKHAEINIQLFSNKGGNTS